MLGIVIFAVTILRCRAEAEFEDVGCFKDEHRHRALPELLKNFRKTIDWENEWPSFERVVRLCAGLAKDKGYLYFGVQYFGECWSGVDGHRTFYMHGKSRQCVHGVGKGCTNRVYMVLGPGREECSAKNYHILNKGDRSMTFKGTGTKCDNPLPHGPGWYRFAGPAGNVMATTPPGRLMCNTQQPGWMKETLPDVHSKAVERKVCFHKNVIWDENICKYHKMIKVRNCGHFIVYKLPVTPTCSLRYCGALNKTLPVNF